VVATPVSNLGELADQITVARNADQFGAAIERALRSGRREPEIDRLRPQAWERRVEQVLGLIDATVGSAVV
jgi:hypothetical protein